MSYYYTTPRRNRRNLQERSYALVRPDKAGQDVTGIKIETTCDAFCLACASLQIGEARLSNWLSGPIQGGFLQTKSMGRVTFYTSERKGVTACVSCGARF